MTETAAEAHPCPQRFRRKLPGFPPPWDAVLGWKLLESCPSTANGLFYREMRESAPLRAEAGWEPKPLSHIKSSRPPPLPAAPLPPSPSPVSAGGTPLSGKPLALLSAFLSILSLLAWRNLPLCPNDSPTPPSSEPTTHSRDDPGSLLEKALLLNSSQVLCRTRDMLASR